MLKISSQQHGFTIFADDDLALLLLPCFFSHALSKTGTAFRVVEVRDRKGFVESELIERDLDDTTANIIINRLNAFLQWVERYSEQSKEVSLSTHHNLSSEILNHYINDVLIEQNRASEVAIQQHLMALTTYYNYLARGGFTNTKKLFVRPELRDQARVNRKVRTAVKYLTPELRSILYRNTKSIRDELLLRTGGELGLRSKENLGILIDDFFVGNRKRLGVLSLFRQMEISQNQMEFEFYLQGIYTKSSRNSGGKSRMIYIHRDLLLRMQEYYETERPKTNENTLFVNNSPSYVGTPIAKSRASRVFKEARDLVLEKQFNKMLPLEGQLLEVDHTHHVLRHSFGTDKFYQLAVENGMAVDNVTATSQVYLTVASLMGHNAADGDAPKTTSIYIRSCHIRSSYEGCHD